MSNVLCLRSLLGLRLRLRLLLRLLVRLRLRLLLRFASFVFGLNYRKVARKRNFKLVCALARSLCVDFALHV